MNYYPRSHNIYVKRIQITPETESGPIKMKLATWWDLNAYTKAILKLSLYGSTSLWILAAFFSVP
jgi:hypothetical protein